jgi:hypothetical protein
MKDRITTLETLIPKLKANKKILPMKIECLEWELRALKAESKLHQFTTRVSVGDCIHIFLQHDSQWQKCAKCGMVVPLQIVR